MPKLFKMWIALAFVYTATCACVTQKVRQELRSQKNSGPKISATLDIAQKIKKASELYLASVTPNLAKSNFHQNLALAASNFKKMSTSELVKILNSDELKAIHQQLLVDGPRLNFGGAQTLQLASGDAPDRWISLLFAGVTGDYASIKKMANDPIIAITSPNYFGAWKEQRVRLQENDLRFLGTAEGPEVYGNPNLQRRIMTRGEFEARIDLLPKDAEEQMRKLVAELRVESGKGAPVSLDDLGSRGADGLFVINDGELLDKLGIAYEQRLKSVAEHFGGDVSTLQEARSINVALKNAEFNDLTRYRRQVLMNFVFDQNVVVAESTDPMRMKMEIDSVRKGFKQPQALTQPQELRLRSSLEDSRRYGESLLELDRYCAGCLLVRDKGQVLQDGDGLFTIRSDARLRVDGEKMVISNLSVKDKSWDFDLQKPAAALSVPKHHIFKKFGTALMVVGFAAGMLAGNEELAAGLALSASPSHESYLKSLSDYTAELEGLWRGDGRK